LSPDESHAELDRLVSIIAKYWSADNILQLGFRNQTSIRKLFAIIAQKYHARDDNYIMTKLLQEVGKDEPGVVITNQLLGGEYFWHVGESTESAIRFCRLFFKDFDYSV
jgi:hypothetical protein